MKRHLLLAARLYPRAWRERYGEEFEALVEDVRPTWRNVADVFAGALKTHMKTAASYWKFAGIMATAGVFLGAAASFTVTPRYVSTALVRINAGGDTDWARNRRQMLVGELRSRSMMAEIIQRPDLTLYPRERRQMPMEEIVDKMRQDLRIEPVGGDWRTMSISFAYPDREKSQAVSQTFADAMAGGNDVWNRNYAALFRAAWPEQKQPPAGPQIEVVQSASYPSASIGPIRLRWALAGLVLGIVIASFLWSPRRAFRFAATGLVCAIVVGGASYLIPDRYTSTAVLRITPAMAPAELQSLLQPEPVETTLHRLTGRVLSDELLLQAIASPYADLYPSKRAGMPPAELAALARKNLQIRPLDDRTFEISFTYPDRYKAQRMVRQMVSNFAGENVIAERARAAGNPLVQYAGDRKLLTNLVVLDPATLPESATFPNRFVIAIGGLVLGLAAAFLRRRPLLAVA